MSFIENFDLKNFPKILNFEDTIFPKIQSMTIVEMSKFPNSPISYQFMMIVTSEALIDFTFFFSWFFILPLQPFSGKIPSHSKHAISVWSYCTSYPALSYNTSFFRSFSISNRNKSEVSERNKMKKGRKKMSDSTAYFWHSFTATTIPVLFFFSSFFVSSLFIVVHFAYWLVTNSSWQSNATKSFQSISSSRS